jgi:SET domain-containing protein
VIRRPKGQAASIAKFEVKRSPIDGRGLFAATAVPARRKLGEMIGTVIGAREARRRARRRKRIAIVEIGDGKAVDAAFGGNQFRFTNHSCTPNAFIRICYGRVEIWSKRKIRAGEEITCNYGKSQHDGKLRCRCAQPGCQGFL